MTMGAPSKWTGDLVVAAAAHVVVLAFLGAGVSLGPAGWLAGATYGVVAGALLAFALRRSRTPALGPANRVTLARVVLVGGVTALMADGDAGRAPVLVALGTVALILDAVDGHVARRTRTVSPLGARFDMEVDAFLILVLSASVSASLGVWVLAIGGMRYLFVVVGWILPWLREPLPPSFARKTVAAVQGVVLVAASAPVVPYPVAVVSVAVALVLLVWSFGRDIGWLWSRRTPRSVHMGPGGTRADASHGPSGGASPR